MDITMCPGTGCKQKDRCYRHLADPDRWQSVYSEMPFDKKTGECKDFWPCFSRSEKKRLDTQHEF
jgi:hypothetical protein